MPPRRPGWRPGWRPHYRPAWLRSDLVAGLTVWAVLVPEALAYATVAGVPPVVGLYAAVPALALYGLFGTSRPLIVAPMSATAVLSATTVAGLAAGGTDRYVTLTAALAVVTGLVGVLAGLLRLGFVASLISRPVLKGFIIGLALTIIAGQVPGLLGVEGTDGDFFGQVWALARRLTGLSLSTAAVGLASLGLLLGLRRWLPRVPGALVAAGLGIAAVAAFDLDRHGVAVVGTVEAGIPRLGVPAGLAVSDVLSLAGPALGVLVIGFAEGLGAAKTYAARTGDHIDPNRELLGVGTANLGAGLASGMVVNGSLSKTAVNAGAGARSQLSAVTAAALTVLALLFLTGLFALLPAATLAAIVIGALLELVNPASLRRYGRVYSRRLGRIYGPAARADFLAACVALLGVLTFGTLAGLAVGVVVSVLLLLYRASRPHVAVLGRLDRIWVDLDRHPAATTYPGIVAVRVEGGLFFANADHVRQRLAELATGDTRALVIDGETVPFIDVTAADMLAELAAQLADSGVEVLLAHQIGQVRDVLARAAAPDRPLRIYPTLAEAVAAAGQ